MYTQFYGLREKPFSLSPDPRYLFLADSHREALAHMLYGIEQGEGFIAVTGEVGTGKTTLCRTLLQRIEPGTEIAFIFNPQLSPLELLQSISTELGLETRNLGRRELTEQLNAFLLAKKSEGRRVLLIIDEAQNLPPETLEQIRLLSNLETDTSKLVQIILIGQPELDALLESQQLRQLRQRISVRWRLRPLTAPETRDYVRHRLRIAAGAPRDLFTELALREVHRRTEGIPRMINLLCDRALLAGYASTASTLGLGLVVQTDREIRGLASGRIEPLAASWRDRTAPWLRVALPATALAGLGALALLAWQRSPAWLAAPPPPPPVAAAPQAPPPGDATPAAGLPGSEDLAAHERSEVPVETDAGASAVADLGATPDVTPVLVGEVEGMGASSVVAPSEEAPPGEAPPQVGAAPLGEPSAAPPVGAEPPSEPSAAPASAVAAAPAPEPVAAVQQVAGVEPSAAPESAAAPGLAAAPPPRADLATELARVAPARATASALDALLLSWGAQPTGADLLSLERALAVLGERGLQSLPLRGAGLAVLRFLDRPTLVELTALDGTQRAVLLETLGEDEVRLAGVTPGAPISVSVASFEAQWTGNGYVVWRDFEPLPPLLTQGQRGAPVAWLQHTLAGLGFYAQAPTGEFDARTADAVRAFQQSRRIAVDGTVGPMTKMELYEAAGRYPRPSLGAGGGRG